MKLPNNERNTGNQRPVGNMAVSVSIPVHQRNTVGLFTSLLITTQGHLTYRQETQKHGKNTMEGRPWNAPISVRKRTINLVGWQAPLYKDVVLPLLRHHNA